MVVKNHFLSTEKIWELLNQIPDPDIPVISIVELGLIRDIKVRSDGSIDITMTPSYSGCPAMNVFKEEIFNTLRENGAQHINLTISHNSSWSTDLLSEETKSKLKQYGIAPPEGKSEKVIALFEKQNITCPNCGTKNTNLTSQFGSTPCKALWFCNNCNQPFEYFKCY